MIKDELIKGLLALANTELQNAKDAHGANFKSYVEVYSVIRGEYREAQEELDYIKLRSNLMFDAISGKWDDPDTQVPIMISDILERAIFCAAECIQIAAVCKKAQEGLK